MREMALTRNILARAAAVPDKAAAYYTYIVER